MMLHQFGFAAIGEMTGSVKAEVLSRSQKFGSEMTVERGRCKRLIFGAMMAPFEMGGSEVTDDASLAVEIDCVPTVATIVLPSEKPRRIGPDQTNLLLEKLGAKGITSADCSLVIDEGKFVVKIPSKWVSSLKNCLDLKPDVKSCFKGLRWASETAIAIDSQEANLRKFLQVYKNVEEALQEGQALKSTTGPNSSERRWEELTSRVYQFPKMKSILGLSADETLDDYDDALTTRLELIKTGEDEFKLVYSAARPQSLISKLFDFFAGPNDVVQIQSCMRGTLQRSLGTRCMDMKVGEKIELDEQQVEKLLDAARRPSERARSILKHMSAYASYARTWEHPITMQDVDKFEEAYQSVRPDRAGWRPTMVISNRNSLDMPDGSTIFEHLLAVRLFLEQDLKENKEVIRVRYAPEQLPKPLRLPRQFAEDFTADHPNLKEACRSPLRDQNETMLFLNASQVQEVLKQLRSHLSKPPCTESQTQTDTTSPTQMDVSSFGTDMGTLDDQSATLSTALQ